MQATNPSPSLTTSNQSLAHSDKALALLLVAFLPALFWSGIFYIVAPTFGIAASPAVISTAFVVIAAFISVVFSALWTDPS
ncbi:MAG: hypothetical protein ACRBCJ_08115 [Hyphomicrobiaceae bacterium]